jgi:protein-disulfide isomerase
MNRTEKLLLCALGIALARGAHAVGSGCEAQTAVAVVGSQTITAAQVEAQLGSSLFRLKSDEYNLKRPALNELISRALLDQEAAARRTSVERLLDIEVDQKAKPVGEDEVAAVYASAKQNYPNVTEAEARRRIAEGMRQHRVQQRRQVFLEELRSRHAVKVLMDPPRAAFKVQDAPALGPSEAPATVVVFTDYQCPHCARVGSLWEKIESRYGASVRLVIRSFPLAFHKDAGKAAEAALCAQEQGEFRKMHDMLFANQRALQVPNLKRYAAEIGLRAEPFAVCLDSGRQESRWKADVLEGTASGVSGTPTFFVNGRLARADATALAQLIDEELEVSKLSSEQVARKR